MDWLAKYQAVIVCVEKIVCIPWGNKTIIIHSDGSNRGNATRLSIISCTKTEKYVKKGFPIFLAHITTKEVEDKSKEKRLEDVPVVRDFPEDPGENSSQSPPHIDHHCCYRCGDSLDGIFYQRCTCESCGNGAHHGYNCPPKVLIISNPEP
nr:putative reverse transcriptase domain-containing protein [Tanacetum cinerariifolium]